MRYLFLAICLLGSVSVFSRNIPDPVLEIGLVLGEPAGITAKYWLTENSAFDFGAGWSSSKELLDICLDYQYHYFWPGFVAKELPLYLGAGTMVRLNKNFMITLRLPLGAEILLEGPGLVFFAQVAPSLSVIPEASLFVAGGLGIRYAF